MKSGTLIAVLLMPPALLLILISGSEAQYAKQKNHYRPSSSSGLGYGIPNPLIHQTPQEYHRPRTTHSLHGNQQQISPHGYRNPAAASGLAGYPQPKPIKKSKRLHNLQPQAHYDDTTGPQMGPYGIPASSMGQSFGPKQQKHHPERSPYGFRSS